MQSTYLMYDTSKTILSILSTAVYIVLHLPLPPLSLDLTLSLSLSVCVCAVLDYERYCLVGSKLQTSTSKRTDNSMPGASLCA